MQKNILYLVDDYLLYYSKGINKIIKYKLTNKALKNGKIANVKLFISSYKNFIKEDNINNSLFGDAITIIINPSYTKVDIEVLKNIFIGLNYRKVNIINEMKLYKLNNSNAYLNYNNTYAFLSYLDYYKEKHSLLITYDLFTDEDIIKLINKKLKKRNIYTFGNNEKIFDLIEKIEVKSSNIGYVFSNKDTFLIDETKKND